MLWKRPRLETAVERPLPAALQHARKLRLPLQALSFGLLVVVFLAALLGKPSPATNLAPVFVLVLFWLGLVAVSLLLGDVWRVLNPWRAGADAAAWLWRRLGLEWERPFSYPERLGRWPAAVLLFAFAAYELAYAEPADPRALALAIAIYSWITWSAMAAFGRETWLENGEAFTSYFGLFARMAPLASRTDTLVYRPPLTGLAAPLRKPGTVALVSVMLGSVLFDGFSRTTWWLDRRFSVEERFALDDPGLAELAGTGLNLAGLAVAVWLMGALFVAAAEVARRVGGRDDVSAATFAGSLVPIAAAYVIAHYFSSLVLQGQLGIRLGSDPFGHGWDLFGTRDFAVVDSIAPNTTWYVQVGALIVGHVAGLVVAHDRAVGLFQGRRASRTQYAMLALMILYTVGGMWVLSSG